MCNRIRDTLRPEAGSDDPRRRFFAILPTFSVANGLYLANYLASNQVRCDGPEKSCIGKEGGVTGAYAKYPVEGGNAFIVELYKSVPSQYAHIDFSPE